MDGDIGKKTRTKLAEGETGTIEDDGHPRKLTTKIIAIAGLAAVIIIISITIVYVSFYVLSTTSRRFQSHIVFGNYLLESDRTVFERFCDNETISNFYITVPRVDGDVTIGLYHYSMRPNRITPSENANNSVIPEKVNVLFYFHGSGEDRTASVEKCKIFTSIFEVFSFDYRGFGDSSPGPVSLQEIVEDVIDIYQSVILLTPNVSTIYFFGNGLGCTIAIQTILKLQQRKIETPQGLILEQVYLDLEEAISNRRFLNVITYFPRSRKIFEALGQNGFDFKNDEDFLGINCPTMILNVEKKARNTPLMMYDLAHSTNNKSRMVQKSESRLILYRDYDPEIFRDVDFTLFAHLVEFFVSSRL